MSKGSNCDFILQLLGLRFFGDLKISANVHVLVGADRDNNCKEQSWKDHCHTQGTQDHTATDVFKKPENNVKVLHFR